MHAKSEIIFNTIPQEILHKILGKISLNQLILSRQISHKMKNLLNVYLKIELQIKQLHCGSNHSIVLFEKGRVFAMGDNPEGQLGFDEKYKTHVPSEIADIDPVKYLSTGFSHSVMLNEMGEIWTMGRNGEQQLPINTEAQTIFLPQKTGFGKIKHIVANDFTTAFISDTGEINTIGNPGLKPVLLKNGLRLLPDWVTLPDNLDVVDASASQSHVLILTSTGECFGMGSNENGLLGLGESIDWAEHWTILSEMSVREIKATSLGSILLTSDNTLMASGMNVKQQFSIEGEDILSNFKIIDKNIKTFAAHDHHTLYLDLSNQLHSMGCNVTNPEPLKKAAPGRFFGINSKNADNNVESSPACQINKRISNMNSFFKLISTPDIFNNTHAPRPT